MSAESIRKVIIDCDPGTDDVQAILMALESPEMEIMAITTTFGNSTADNTSINALRILKLMNRLEIPVYKGCSTALNGTPEVGNGYHGNDGLGDVPHLYKVDSSALQKEHSAIALLNLVNKYPGVITLVAMAPLTNIAVALQLDPQFGQKLKSCVIMGGNTTGKGNVTKRAEFNFYSDPEAAAKVLKDLNTKIMMVPMELCQEYSFSWEWYTKYISRSTQKAIFVKETDIKTTTANRQSGEPLFWTYDQLAIAIVIRDDIALQTKSAKATIKLHAEEERGMMILDWEADRPNVFIVTQIDKEKYENEVFKAVV